MGENFWGSAAGFLDDDEEVEEQAGFADFQAGRDGVIFLIDCSLTMARNDNKMDSGAILSLKCAKSVLMNKAISSEKDLVGIVFFGTKESKNDQQSNSVFVYQDLDMPNADRVLELEASIDEFSKDGENNKHGHSLDYSLADALWVCSSLFSKSSTKIGNKRILIFTNNDDPHSNSSELKRKAVRRAKDVADLGIYIDLMHLSLPGQPSFEVENFYQDVVNVDEDEANNLDDPSEKFSELMTRVIAKDHKKRPLAHLPLVLGGGVKLSVSVYTLCRAATKGSYVHVDSRSNEEVKCMTKMICEDTGHELLPTDIKYQQTFGGAKVTFEKEEVSSIKSFGDVGLHILGFRPRSSLKCHTYVKPGHFIYPDEKTVAGSQCLFTALLKRCLARDLIINCLYIPRSGAAPRLATLLPQEEELDDNKIQMAPPGFHVVILPFSDDVRKLVFPEAPKASPEQIDAAKMIVEKLKFAFSPEHFENPALQRFYRGLEALALDRDDVEDAKDLTLPQMEKIDTKVKWESVDFLQLVYPIGYDPDANPKKRKAVTSRDTKPKQAKADYSEEDIRKMANNSQLNKLTVAVLKQFCDANQLSTASKKKADLIDAVEMHFS